ncbi:MAG: transglutaminase family protein [Rhodobacteraceae bacterium]|nr:transglutaminase family protein [Paracoccaceae bacterium]
MRLRISHKTTYSYDTPVHYALQQLRLRPRTGHGQTVVEWSTEISGATRQLSFEDQFSNQTDLLLADEGTTHIEVHCEGVVDTTDTAGVIGRHKGFAPLWLFLNETTRTKPGPELRRLAREVSGEDDTLARMHALSTLIYDQVAYDTGTTDSDTTAETALTEGHGVCQDHAHVMIAAARLLGHPARYISGYLLMDGIVEQDASHAWCEVWTDTLGWVGFDVSNRICPDERYVRVATGRDYGDAAPILGIRQGAGSEDLHVTLQVQQ